MKYVGIETLIISKFIYYFLYNVSLKSGFLHSQSSLVSHMSTIRQSLDRYFMKEHNLNLNKQSNLKLLVARQQLDYAFLKCSAICYLFFCVVTRQSLDRYFMKEHNLNLNKLSNSKLLVATQQLDYVFLKCSAICYHFFCVVTR